MPRKDPIIFVIGCTGTGKSDLGVAIAKKYNGEIISVDSMQFYQGLDIATNKITVEEADGVPHHMMSFLDPSSTAGYHVHQFRSEALRLIDEIRDRYRIPILVGDDETSDTEFPENDLSNAELWEMLKKIDPESAKLIHPNRRKRVIRAIEVFRQTGKKKSELIKEQKSSENADLGGRLRYPDSLVIYMDAAPEVLEKRLDTRVEKMIRMGLKNELIAFYDKHKSFISSNSYGVMQCIGLKEFVPWLSLDTEQRESRQGIKLFEQGCEDVKLHTRQYARRQRRWYMSRLLRRSDGERKMASTKMIDTSDKSLIISTGMDIVDSWMSGINYFEEVPQGSRLNSVDANILKTCDVCNIIISGKNNWEKHIAGKPHRHRQKKFASQRTGITA
ncbi:unnamed protein product [Caenorhabditis bovis]|uniref:C2H2-type domain-containing protein n=1 Tax=Caenorhabditis bovis TaxID=2654633 RepID=A0A8S1EKP0_9PELO|nr:unnamed protein product [Caenorhabditis bovis]